MKELNTEDYFEMSNYIRCEVTGEETVVVEDKSYDCLVVTIEIEGDFIEEDGTESELRTSGKVWIDKTTEKPVKNTQRMKINVGNKEDRATYILEQTMIIIYEKSTWVSEDEPEIGDTWKVTKKMEGTVTETYETQEENMKSTDSLSQKKITHYEYLKDETITMELGTFDCRVIKSYNDDNYYNPDVEYSLNYFDKELNLPIKLQNYDFGVLTSEMVLISYKIGDVSGGEEVIGPLGSGDEKEDEGILGLGKVAGIDTFILIIMAILTVLAMIILGFALNKRKKSRRARAEAYAQPEGLPPPPPPPQPGYRKPSYQYSPPPPPPRVLQIYYEEPPPPPPPPPPPLSQNSCWNCGGPLEWVDYYESWYCDYCGRYR
ncbi:MAG: hypothetical protein JSV49_10505 [Thermoplasmata archaeon]|nr:MAG: hypothetical protein JSV49_10505 [Thermoplasmata archaeon]